MTNGWILVKTWRFFQRENRSCCMSLAFTLIKIDCQHFFSSSCVCPAARGAYSKNYSLHFLICLPTILRHFFIHFLYWHDLPSEEKYNFLHTVHRLLFCMLSSVGEMSSPFKHWQRTLRCIRGQIEGVLYLGLSLLTSPLSLQQQQRQCPMGVPQQEVKAKQSKAKVTLNII